MFQNTFAWLLLFLLGLAPSEAPAQKTKKESPEIHGAFGLRKGGAGFLMLNGRIFIEAVVIQGDTVESGAFLLDTGAATGCVLDRNFAEKVKIVGIGHVTLKFGGGEIKNVKTTVLDHPLLQRIFRENAPKFQNKPVWGVIGYPALTSQRVQIDFKDYVIRFLPHLSDQALPEKPDPDEIAVPFAGEKVKDENPKSIRINLKLNNKLKGIFLLNSGEPASWILKEAATKAGLRRNKPPRSLKAGDRELPCPSFSFLAIDNKKEKKPAPVQGMGCLGTDFLRQFIITIDHKNRKVAFLPIKKKPEDKTKKNKEKKN